MKRTLLLFSFLLTGFTLLAQEHGDPQYLFYSIQGYAFNSEDTLSRASLGLIPIENEYLSLRVYYIKDSTDNYQRRLAVHKMDSLGVFLNETYLDSSNVYWPYPNCFWTDFSNKGRQLIKTSDGQFATVFPWGTDQTDGQIRVIKFDESGNRLWSKDFQEDENNDNLSDVFIQPIEIINTSDNGYLVNSKAFFNDSTTTTLLHKLDETGELQWKKYYYYDEAQSTFTYNISVSPNNDYFLSGSFENTNSHSFVSKMDLDGNIIWEKKLSGEGGGYVGRNVVFDDRILINYHDINDGGYLLALDLEEGNILWEKGGFGFISSLVVLENSFIGVNAYFGSIIIRLISVSKDGDLLFNKSIQNYTSTTIRPHSLKATPDGGYILESFLELNDDHTLWLLKTDHQGECCSTNSECSEIRSFNSINNISSSNEINISPNPITKNRLQFKHPILNKGQWIIYDLNGQIILEGDIKETKESNINIEYLAKGMYVLKLKSEKEIIGIAKFIKE